MRKVLILTLGASMLLTGCADPEAQQKAQTRKDVDNVLAKLKATQAGYVPKGQGVGATDEARIADVESYQIKQNTDAVAELQKLLPGLPPQQRASAHMVIANADIQAAMVASRDARTQGARICASAVGLLGRLSTAAEAQGLATTYKKHLDGSVLRDLNEMLRGYETQLATQVTLSNQLTKDAAALQTEAELLSAQADKLNAEVRELRQQAFIKAGKEQIEFYKKAANLEIEAQKSQTQQQLRLVRRDIVVSQLAIALASQGSLQQSVEVTKEQIKVAQNRQRELEAKVRGLTTASTVAIASINELYNELEDSRKKSVEAVFKVAIQRATSAVSNMDEAVKLSQGNSDQERYYKLELLGKRELLLDIYVQQLAFDADYAETLGLVTKAAADQGVPISDSLLQGQQVYTNDQKSLGPVAQELHQSAAVLVTDLTQSNTSSDEAFKLQVQAAYNRLQALGNALSKLVNPDSQS